MENMFAILEFLRFRVHCTEQQRFIEEERLHRKKTAKERYQRKKLSIHKKKRKRTKKLSKINVEDGDLDDEELIALGIANKKHIETAVTSTPIFDREGSYVGDDEEEESVYGVHKESDHSPVIGAASDAVITSTSLLGPFGANLR